MTNVRTIPVGSYFVMFDSVIDDFTPVPYRKESETKIHLICGDSIAEITLFPELMEIPVKGLCIFKSSANDSQDL